MNNREIVTDYLIRENGKPRVKLSRNMDAVTFSRITGQKFNYNKVNMFIMEQKLNSKEPRPRQFIISMRMDGYRADLGEFKLAQMNFDYDDLVNLQKYIGKILEDE